METVNGPSLACFESSEDYGSVGFAWVGLVGGEVHGGSPG